jgi:hypothetical protein
MAALANPSRPRAAVVKPPLLNFAGVCLHCGDRWCEARKCADWHASSCWMVCPDCRGDGWTDTLLPCGCLFGVVEASAAADRGGQLSAV